MEAALWAAQGLLSVVMLGSGLAKATMSKDRMLATGQTGVVDVPLPVIRLVATAELLGAFGVILPELTGIAPFLTPLAAAGFGVIMLGAARIHRRLGEPRNVAVNLVLLALALLVVYGRAVR